LSRGEISILALTFLILLGFGYNLERRTALRRVPMTDLGVYVCGAGAVRDGQDLYRIVDWRGWHYNYPPAMAILLRPLAHPVPTPPEPLPPGTARTAANTPWGYSIDAPGNHCGLNKDNARFFWIVAVWYSISVSLAFLSAHLLACALERRRWNEPPLSEAGPRRRWWTLRAVPMLICITSIGTDLSRGQVDLVMLAAISLAVYFATREQGLLAGVLLSVPACMKMFPAVLLWYPLWRRHWRMMFGAAAGLALLLFVVPVVALGPQRALESYQTFIDVLVKPGLGSGEDASRAEELTNVGATDNQSLLATMHRWSYPAGQRPLKATRAERLTSYAVGALMLFGWSFAAGWRRKDSPRQVTLLLGALMGITLVISPVAHNYYFLLLLPLVAGLVDEALAQQEQGVRPRTLIVSLITFTSIDILARIPGIGGWLREAGLPLLSLAGLICLASLIIYRHRGVPGNGDPSHLDISGATRTAPGPGNGL
jgi:hypothetical protein